MANLGRRPLPVPPIGDYRYAQDMDYPPYGYTIPPPLAPKPKPYEIDEQPRSSILRGGALLHKGFYDLLAMIPTPSASKFFWGTPSEEPVVAGPRYEDLDPSPAPPLTSNSPSSPFSPKKGRRISKDMVSKPTGFVYVLN